jgi:hypothetical protein
MDANLSFETEEEDRRETSQSCHRNVAELAMAEPKFQGTLLDSIKSW